MDRFFDRLGELLRSLTGAEVPAGTGYDPRDPDMRAALEELDAWLGSGGEKWRAPGGGSRGRQQQEPRQSGQEQRDRQHEQRGRPQPPPGRSGNLQRHYANLEVPFGAPLEQVQRSYRKLLSKYHPDRFGRDPEKLKLATEITQRLNESFQSIRRHHRDRGPRG